MHLLLKLVLIWHVWQVDVTLCFCLITVLIYEPDHPVALQFQPVIAEKIQQGMVKLDKNDLANEHLLFSTCLST